MIFVSLLVDAVWYDDWLSDRGEPYVETIRIYRAFADYRIFLEWIKRHPPGARVYLDEDADNAVDEWFSTGTVVEYDNARNSWLITNHRYDRSGELLSDILEIT